jgi:hypothetical protein
VSGNSHLRVIDLFDCGRQQMKAEKMLCIHHCSEEVFMKTSDSACAADYCRHYGHAAVCQGEATACLCGVDLGGLGQPLTQARLRVWHPFRYRTSGATAAMATWRPAPPSIHPAVHHNPPTRTMVGTIIGAPLAPPGPRQGWLSPLIPTSRSKCGAGENDMTSCPQPAPCIRHFPEKIIFKGFVGQKSKFKKQHNVKTAV